MADSTITESEMLSAVLDARLGELHTALPGIVESYDASSQTATIRNAVHDDGSEPVSIPGVPVIWPRCASAYLAMPLSAGDTGLLVFCERDIRTWRRTGQVMAPGDLSTHAMSSAVFLPGLHVKSGSVASPPGATVLSSSDLRLGSSTASDFVLRGTAFNADLTTFLGAVVTFANALSASHAEAGALSTAATALGNQLAGNLSAKVKVD